MLALSTSPLRCARSSHRPDTHHQLPLQCICLGGRLCSYGRAMGECTENHGRTHWQPGFLQLLRPTLNLVLCPWLAQPHWPAASTSSYVPICPQLYLHHWPSVPCAHGETWQPQYCILTMRFLGAASEPIVIPRPWSSPWSLQEYVCLLHGHLQLDHAAKCVHTSGTSFLVPS